MTDYRCVHGHDKCSEMYPGPDCPYCERVTDMDAILAKATEDWFAFLCRKYVQRADDRQRELGCQYTEAETRDLAKECARFAINAYEPMREALKTLEAECAADVARYEEMRARGDLTKDWGQCSLISARQFLARIRELVPDLVTK